MGRVVVITITGAARSRCGRAVGRSRNMCRDDLLLILISYELGRNTTGGDGIWIRNSGNKKEG
jgi:hypothetical protein